MTRSTQLSGYHLEQREAQLHFYQRTGGEGPLGHRLAGGVVNRGRGRARVEKDPWGHSRMLLLLGVRVGLSEDRKDDEAACKQRTEVG